MLNAPRHQWNGLLCWVVLVLWCDALVWEDVAAFSVVECGFAFDEVEDDFVCVLSDRYLSGLG